MHNGTPLADRPIGGALIRMSNATVAAIARQQRQLLYIGGGVLTALVLIALIVGVLTTYRGVYAERAEIVRDGQSALVDILSQRNLGTAGYAAISEGVWATQSARLEAEGRPIAASFETSAHLAVVRGDDSALPWLVLGQSDLRMPKPTLAKYLGMAREYSLLARSTSLFKTTGADAGAVFEYDPSHSLVLVAGLDSDAFLRKALSVATNDQAIATLIDIDRRLMTRAITSRVGSHELRFAFARHPLTGQPAIYTSLPLRSHHNEYLRRVFFEPASELARRLQTRVPGGLMLFTSEGESILDTSDGTIRLNPTEIRTMLAQASTNPARRHSWASAQHMAVMGSVAGTDWVLAHTFSRRDLWIAITQRAAWQLVVGTLLIAGLWVLLLRMHRRVLRPALVDAERVYESEALSRTIIDTSPVGLCVVDAGGSVLLRNERAATLLTSEELMAALEGARIGTAPSPNDVPFEVDCQNADGDRIQITVSPIRLNDTPSWLCALRDVTAERELEDSREHARIEAEHAKQHAEDASRAKSSFVASISHEIRTPLHGITGHLELLTRSNLNPEQAERVERIRQSADSLMTLISDVLDFSKIEAGQLEVEQVPFSLRHLIERTAVLFAPHATMKSLALVTYISPRLGDQYVSDPKLLQQILHNLLSNAIKFTSSGNITVTAHQRRIPSDAREWIALSVRDTGIGMSAHQQANLFQPFTQADTSIARRYGGTGLGLALSLELARLLGGSLTVRSTQGRGTVFTLCIPVSRAASPRPVRTLDEQQVVLVARRRRWRVDMAAYLRARGARVLCKNRVVDARSTEGATLWWVDELGNHAGHERLEGWRDVVLVGMNGPLTPLEEEGRICVSCFASDAWDAVLTRHVNADRVASQPVEDAGLARFHGKVLLVDDHPVNRELIRQQLEVLGLTVEDAATGSDAFRLWKPGRYAAVLTDVHMPDVSGYDVARAIRTSDRTIPIIAVTASALASERDECRKAGITDLLLKPILLGDLRSVLLKHLIVDQVANLEAMGAPAPRTSHAAVRKLFAEQAGADLLKLATLVAARDTKGLLALVHSLKGALLMLREYSAAALCSGVEQSLRQEPFDSSLTSIAELTVALERLLTQYRQAAPDRG